MTSFGKALMRSASKKLKPNGLLNQKIELTPLSEANYPLSMDPLPSEIFVRPLGDNES